MNNKLNKQLNIQRNLILVLVVLLVFTSSTSLTYALYRAFVRESVQIQFSNPVNVFVTTNALEPQDSGDTHGLIEGFVYPGTRLNLNLGFELGSETDPALLSSPGYIRVKIDFSSDADPEGSDQTLLSAGLVQIMAQNSDGEDSIDLSKWLLVDFSEAQDGSDMWWVYTTTTVQDTTTSHLATEVQNGDYDDFIDGLIIMNTTLDNAYANKEIHINFYVSAIQTMNIDNPLLNIYQSTDEESNPVYVDSFYYAETPADVVNIPVYTGATWGQLTSDTTPAN